MTEASQKVLAHFQVRKSKSQKTAFRDFLQEELGKLGYQTRVEAGKGIIASYNVVAGDAEKARVIFTAHYDTCSVLPVPNFITPRNMLWYLLYQLALVGVMLGVGAAAEVALLLLWPDCPMWAAVGTIYAVMAFEIWWLIDGGANKHTANDNTSGVVTLLEIAAALPEELRNSVCLVFFDNEEKGLFGSAAFAKAHKTARRSTPVVNFDCVGDGDFLQFFPTSTAQKDPVLITHLAAAFTGEDGKKTEVVKGFGFYPSDQRHFAKGVGVCALKKNRLFGYYMNRIHTKRDTVLDEENIRVLCAGALRMAELASPKKLHAEQ